MKRISTLLTIVFMASCTSTFAKMIVINVEQTNGTVALSFSDRAVSRDKFTHVLNKLGTIDSNQTIIVRSAADVTTTLLMGVLYDIQKAGLWRVVLITPGEENGVKGAYVITLNTEKRPFFSDIGLQPLKTGFVPDDESELEEIGKEEISQQRVEGTVDRWRGQQPLISGVGEKRDDGRTEGHRHP